MGDGIFTRDVLRDRFMTILSCCAASRDDIQVDFVAKFVFVSASSKRGKYQTRQKRGKVILMIRSSYHSPVSRKFLPII
jgi:hypothetical protein